MPDESIERLAKQFQAMSEVSRLKLIFALEAGERNVSDLVAITGLGQSNVSKHLRILKTAGIVVRRKEGLNAVYRVAEPSVFDLLELGSLSVEEFMR